MISLKRNEQLQAVEFSDLAPLLDGRSKFLILDRDGTLVPYSPTPELAFLPPRTKTVLSDIVDHHQAQVAIVSARNLKSLQAEFDPAKQILAGNYGLEISFPSGQKFVHPAATSAVPLMAALADDLAAIVARYPQLILDNHHYSVCLHYHLLPPHKQSHVAALIDDLRLKYPSLVFHDLPTSYEVVPAIEWHKGRALEQIALQLSLAEQEILFITAGDTEADEPMFEWVNARQGITFNVGERASAALGRFDTSEDLYAFLRAMLDLKTPQRQHD